MKAHLLHIHTANHTDHGIIRIEEILFSVSVAFGRALYALVWLLPIAVMIAAMALGGWALVGWLEKLVIN